MVKPKGRGHWFWPWARLFVGLIILGVGIFFAVKWLTTDEPDRYGRCSTGGESCLQGGESLNRTMTLIFGSLGLIGTAWGTVTVVRHRRRTAADRDLIANGRHADAEITHAELHGATTTTMARVTSQGYLLTLDPGDGGPPLGMEVELPPGVTRGARVRVAYDPTTRDAVLLDAPSESIGGM